MFIKKSELFATGFGNALEWFDYGLFLFLAPTLGKIFFPVEHSSTALLAAFAAFSSGYICRPLGGIIFGHLGDKKGRILALRRSIFFISFSTFFIAILPGYQSIGIASSLLFISLRILQGISAGGEYSGIMVYLAEKAPIEKRGFITSFAGVGSCIGFLLASFIVYNLNKNIPSFILEDYFWRIPFAFIGIIGSIIFLFRFKMKETKTYTKLKKKKLIHHYPLFYLIKKSPKSLLKIMGLTCISSTFYILFFAYMPHYLANYSHLSLTYAFKIQTFQFILMLFFLPIAGFLGDKFGRKNMLLFSTLCIMFLAVPAFILLHQDNSSMIYLTLTGATILSSIDQGNNVAAFVENCPAEFRYSGVAFAYNMGNALFGGTAPFTVTFLSNFGNFLVPGYFLVCMGVISLFSIVNLTGKKVKL